MRKWVGLAALGIALLAVDVPQVQAEEDGCFVRLRDCYYRAAKESYWGDMWLRGLDCELEFVDCVRRRVIGR